MRKAYVSVNCTCDCDGNVTPAYLIWEDGQRYEIDRVLDVRKAASLKAGGSGTRYTCRVSGRQVYLFYEDMCGKWFMEGK